MQDITNDEIGVNGTAVALGYFDGLHLGHTEVLKAVLGTNLPTVVFTFSEDTVLPKFYRAENIITYSQKLVLFEKLGINYLFAPHFSDIRYVTADEFVEKILIGRLHSSVVACGYNFHFGRGGSKDAPYLQELCEKNGIKCIIIPPVMLNKTVVSSSLIRGYIREGKIELANKMLGYSVAFNLKVINGNRIGRTIGFPTINQEIPAGSVVPRYGVYKTWVTIGNDVYKGITNIGIKPTINKETKVPLIETNILGYDGDLEGQQVEVSLEHFIRDERRFADLDELKEQIRLDIGKISS